MIDPLANFSGFPAGYNPFAAMAQAFQAMPQAAPVQMPQMTPQQLGYGPMHSALAQSLAQALQAQMGGGLLGSPTPESMGLLSTAMIPATAVGLPTTGAGPALGPNQYYRMNNAFWGAMPNTLGGGGGGGSTGSTGSTGGKRDVRGSNDIYRDRNSGGRDTTQSVYGNAGGGLSDYGQRELSNYGGIF